MVASLLYEEDVYSPLDHHPKPQGDPKTVLIGMHGFASSGKDTSGRLLIDHRGYTRISFADPLRRIAALINPVVRWDHYGNSWTLNEVIEDLGYEEAKKVGLTRRFLQKLGEGVRDEIGEDTWVNAAMAKVQRGQKHVFTDVRFPNEAEAVRNAGGVVVEVVRPGVKPVNDHVSDRRLPDHLIDFTVQNDGTIADLYFRLDGIAEHVERPAWLTS